MFTLIRCRTLCTWVTLTVCTTAGICTGDRQISCWPASLNDMDEETQLHMYKQTLVITTSLPPSPQNTPIQTNKDYTSK